VRNENNHKAMIEMNDKNWRKPFGSSHTFVVKKKMKK